jgi:hypothetical protein
MANMDNFTSDEWWQLRNAPLAVAMYVSGADARTGPVGTIKELSAPFNEAKKHIQNAPAGSLLLDLLNEWATMLKKGDEEEETPRIGVGPDLLSFITHVGKLLDAKASAEDAKAVKEWLAHAAKISAEAGKEGAVLGLGGEKVSDAEYKALSEIGLALGVAM